VDVFPNICHAARPEKLIWRLQTPSLDRRSLPDASLVKLTSPSASDTRLTLGYQHGHLDEIDSNASKYLMYHESTRLGFVCRGGVLHEIAARRSREA
jgi:hypothetical protein